MTGVFRLEILYLLCKQFQLSVLPTILSSERKPRYIRFVDLRPFLFSICSFRICIASRSICHFLHPRSLVTKSVALWWSTAKMWMVAVCPLEVRWLAPLLCLVALASTAREAPVSVLLVGFGTFVGGCKGRLAEGKKNDWDSSGAAKGTRTSVKHGSAISHVVYFLAVNFVATCGTG